MPAVVEVASSAPTVRRQRKAAPCKAEPGAGTIEVDGVMIRVGRGADAETLMVVLRVLKAGA
jgi:transposase